MAMCWIERPTKYTLSANGLQYRPDYQLLLTDRGTAGPARETNLEIMTEKGSEVRGKRREGGAPKSQKCSPNYSCKNFPLLYFPHSNTYIQSPPPLPLPPTLWTLLCIAFTVLSREDTRPKIPFYWRKK